MSVILIADDLEENRYLLRTLLAAASHQVVEAANGVEALSQARRATPDLIISDILMPQLDGFALCRECKRDAQLRSIPFVFYTATYTDPRDEALALQLGAARFIVKPVENEAFLSIIQELLQAGAAGQLEASPVQPEEETVFFRLYNEALIRKLEDKMLTLDRINRSLVESEERFRRLAENAPDLIYRYEFLPKPRFAYVSPAATLVVGYTPEEYYADPELGFKIVHPADRPLLEASQQGGLAPGQPLILRWVRKDGEVIWTEQRNTPVYNAAGELAAIEGVARDITARKQRERELEAIAVMGAALRVARTRIEMLPVILDQLLALLEVDGSALIMHDPLHDDLHIELGRGVWAFLTHQHLSAGAGVSAQVLTSGQPYLNNDVRNDPRHFSDEAFNACPCAACTPLSAQGQIIGLLWIGRNRPLAAQDLRLLCAIGDMAANAIHRAALHEETARRVEQLQALQTIDRAITASQDLHLSLNILLEQALAQLHADAAGVLLCDQRALVLHYAAGRGFRTRLYEHSQVRLGEGLAGQAALERRTLYTNDLNATPATFSRLTLLAGEGFVAYAATPLTAKGQIKGVLEIFQRSTYVHDDDWLNFLKALAQQAAIAIDNAQLFDNLQQSNVELSLAYDATIEGWSRALDLRDHETEGHALRVAEMTLRLARAAGLAEDELVHVRRGALLHDMGKMGIPDTILLKPAKLVDEEWVVMRKHPDYAYDMLRDITHLHPALDIPYCHHEKWDGTGYPRGLKGTQIPLTARLFAVVDVWDALTSDRPYRKAWSQAQALDYLRAEAGKHFDPQAVELFLRVQEEAPDLFLQGKPGAAPHPA
jgi:PAS domain S-box-containing protein